jgi:hypothetical protein
VPFPLPARLAWRAEVTLIDFALADFGLADFALADFVFDLALAAMSVSGVKKRWRGLSDAWYRQAILANRSS